MFEWNNQLETGISDIDQQHRELVAMLAKLFDAMNSGAGSAVIDEILTGLDEYSEQHFAVEEQLMQSHAYPDLEDHQAEHAVFKRKIASLKAGCQQGGQGVLSIQVILFLRNWLTEHISTIDQSFGRYLQKKAL